MIVIDAMMDLKCGLAEMPVLIEALSGEEITRKIHNYLYCGVQMISSQGYIISIIRHFSLWLGVLLYAVILTTVTRSVRACRAWFLLALVDVQDEPIICQLILCSYCFAIGRYVRCPASPVESLISNGTTYLHAIYQSSDL